MKTVRLTRVNVFVPAALCVIALGFAQMVGAAPVWVDGFTSPLLPPVHPNPNVAYYSDEDGVYYPYYSLGIFVTNIVHGSFTNINRSALGIDEFENFDSVLTADVTITGMGSFSTTMTGPVYTEVFGKVGQTTGTWNTEVLSMTLSGNIGGNSVMIRESPTLQSTGETSVQFGNDYRIESFFDVFTELSLDGGQTWVPSTGSCRMTLIPEPATICLLVLGAGLLKRSRR
jgi:hypothetical protein